MNAIVVFGLVVLACVFLGFFISLAWDEEIKSANKEHRRNRNKRLGRRYDYD